MFEVKNVELELNVELNPSVELKVVFDVRVGRLVFKNNEVKVELEVIT